MRAGPAPGRLYLRFVGLLVVISALMMLIGYLPTRRLGGDGAVAAMLAGCGASALASAIGAAPLALAGRAAGGPSLSGFLASGALRIALVLALTLALALSGVVERTPLLVWVGISYPLLLAADVWFGLTLGRAAGGGGS